jgi:hypothetical protein
MALVQQRHLIAIGTGICLGKLSINGLKLVHKAEYLLHVGANKT